MKINYPFIILLLALSGLVLFTCKHYGTVAGVGGNAEPVDSFHWLTDGGDIVASEKGSPEAFAQVNQHIADSVAKVYKTKVANLQEYIIALEHAHADVPARPGGPSVDFSPPVISGHGDTCPPQIRRLRQQFASPYYSADVQLGDSSFLQLDARDTLTAVWKNGKEGGLFHRRQYLQLDISSANPDLRIYGLQAYRRTIPKKKWAIGFQLGYGFLYDNGQLRSGPYAGLGITKTFINF